jgi:hypothetical protein
MRPMFGAPTLFKMQGAPGPLRKSSACGGLPPATLSNPRGYYREPTRLPNATTIPCHRVRQRSTDVAPRHN